MNSVLFKADATDKDILYIEASNPQQDSQKEVVLKSALEAETEHFLKVGVVSYDHQHKISKDPSFIVGEPLDVKFSADDRTLVKARMYNTKYGTALMELAKANSSRLGASIGGYVVQRTQKFDRALQKAVPTIARLLWDEVALTAKAVNEGTTVAGGGRGVSVMPFPEFKKAWIEDPKEREEIVKALMAGYGTDSATFTGGRSLQEESFQGAKKKKRERMQHAFKCLLSNLGKAKHFDYYELERICRSYGVEEETPNMARLIVQSKGNVRKVLSC